MYVSKLIGFPSPYPHHQQWLIENILSWHGSDWKQALGVLTTEQNAVSQ